jgi:hypothetical protein
VFSDTYKNLHTPQIKITNHNEHPHTHTKNKPPSFSPTSAAIIIHRDRGAPPYHYTIVQRCSILLLLVGTLRSISMSRCTDLHERGGRMIEGAPHRMDQQAEQRPRVNVLLAVLESAIDIILDSSYRARADGHHDHYHSNRREQEQQQATRAGRNTVDATVSSNDGEEDYSSSSSSSSSSSTRTVVVVLPASSTTASPPRRLPHSSPNRGLTN